MAGLILGGRCLQSLMFYEGWPEAPEEGVKGMVRLSILPSQKFGKGAR
jgi:hypothetical protein